MSDWIGWGGGKCPVPTGVLFEYRLRDGGMGAPLTTSTAWQWEHTGSPFDIVAYRLVRAPAGGDLVERARESKEATHQRFYTAFHDWFMQSGCDFWSECDAPELLATIAVEISDTFAATIQREAREAGIAEAAQTIRNFTRYSYAEQPTKAAAAAVALEVCEGYVRALSGTAPQSGKMCNSTWRKIETAPKDGTYILGNKRFLDAGWSPRVMRWERGYWMTNPGEWAQRPTHWMPLPPAPPTGDATG